MHGHLLKPKMDNSGKVPMVFAVKLSGTDLIEGSTGDNFKMLEIKHGDFDKESYITGIKDKILPCSVSSNRGCIQILYNRVKDDSYTRGLYYLRVNIHAST